jgi:hypothetical protein
MDRTKLLEARHYIHIGVRASEEWQPSYKRNRSTFRALLGHEAELENAVSEYLYEASERAPQYVDWSQMPAAVRATAGPVDNNDSEAWRIEAALLADAVTDSIIELVATGAHAGELTYGIETGVSTLSEEVLKAAREQVATLVSQVTDTTRNLIRESVAQSIDRGEDVTKAIERLKKVVNNPVRAELIARTESVNSYQTGLANFARQTGAISKTWECLVGACALCRPLDGVTIPIDDKFVLANGREVDRPSGHVRCRCGTIWNYPESS